jgi:hypothetical protein
VQDAGLVRLLEAWPALPVGDDSPFAFLVD